MEKINYFIQDIFQTSDRARGEGADCNHIYKCATPIIRYALKHKDLLWPENHFILYRPDNPSFIRYYSPDGSVTWTYDTPEGHFKIHYSESGIHAVFGSDGIQSTIPDYVVSFGSYFERAWYYETNPNRLGYAPPPTDGNRGGDSRLDVYIKYLNDIYGYTQVEYGHPFIVVHNNYKGFYPNSDPDGSRAGNMKVTAAHEFFHAIQYEYENWHDNDRFDSNIWWEESTAAWIEDEVYDQVDDYIRYLPSRINYLDISLDDDYKYNNSLPSNFTYGGVIWVKFLSETYGKDIIRHIFEQCLVINPPLAKKAIEDTLHNYNTDWGEALSQFYIKNLTLDYEEYKEGSSYPSVSTEVITDSDFESGFSNSKNLVHLSCNYVKIELDPNMQGWELILKSQSGKPPIILLAPDQSSTGDPLLDLNDIRIWPYQDMEFALDEFGTSSTYPRAYLIIINPDPYRDNCLYSLTTALNSPKLQTPEILYPASGQTLIFEKDSSPFTIRLSVKNIDEPPDPNRGIEYTFELYKNMDFTILDTNTVIEDPNGITSYKTHLNQGEGFYYWRCQATSLDQNEKSFWTPMVSFYPLAVNKQVIQEILINPFNKIIEVSDPNSPIYGTSVKLNITGDPNQYIFIAHVPDPTINTGKILPVGDWVYFGSEGHTFSRPVTITLTYNQKKLEDPNITDADSLMDPNKLGIYQYQTKDPYFYAPLIKIASRHDPNNRTLEGDINNSSLYVVGFSPSSSQSFQDTNDGKTDQGQGNTMYKSGGGCFISALP